MWDYQDENWDGCDEDVRDGAVATISGTCTGGFDLKVQLDADEAHQLYEKTPRANGEEDARIELGQLGERVAGTFLLRRGYELVERNWRCRYGEADLIAIDGEDLVVVEVKTRSGHREGFPEDAVTPQKRHRYEQIAACYLADKRLEGSFNVRFDVVAILVLGPHRAFLRHHRNAFYAAGE